MSFFLDLRYALRSLARAKGLTFTVVLTLALGIGANAAMAGVLAFSVSARTREFGIRLAVGSTPSALLARIVREGAVIGVSGIITGAVIGLGLARVVSSYVTEIEIPGVVPIVGAGAVLVAAAMLASLMPAARASRVDVISALRGE